MTFLASSGAALWSQVQTWMGRANAAWGASRVWNSGSSFESDSATWNARANQAWGASRVWSSGQSFEVDRNAAYDGGSWGVGNLWSTDAHGDPNVWTTRYNTGYSDGNTAGYNSVVPANPMDHLAASARSAKLTLSGSQDVASVRLDRDGQWLLIARNNCVDSSFGSNMKGTVYLLINGVNYQWVQKDQGNGNAPGSMEGLCVWYQAALNGASSVINVTVRVNTADGDGGARDCIGYIDAYFIPTVAQPH